MIKMIKKFSRYITGATCLLLCAAMLSGCGIIAFNSPDLPDDLEETYKSAETDEPYSVQEYEKYVSDYADLQRKFANDTSDSDYGGGTFLIANTKEKMIVPDENTGAVLSKEYERRNAVVEAELNIMLAEKLVQSETLYSEVKQAVKSSSYYADLILIPQAEIGTYATDGLIANLAGLPGIKFDREYYNSSSVAATGGNSKVYGIAGDACTDYDSLSAVYFNKSLLSQITGEDIYKLVDDGAWTWTKLLEYADAVSSLEGDYYSVGAQNTVMYLQDLIFVSSGLQFVDCSYGEMPQIAFTAETANPVVDLIKKVMNHPKRNNNNLDAITAFAGGNTLFLIDTLATMKTLSSSSADWGIVPLPKGSAQQESYRTLAFAENAMFFAMVPTVSDSRKISDVLAMLNIASYGDTPDAFAENAMTYYLRDNASTKNVALIINSAVYDFSYSFASEAKAISNATHMNIRNSSTNFYNVQSYLNSWTRAFNNAVNSLFG